MTVPVAFHELDKIEMVRSLDGDYRIDHTVTAIQKAILDVFGIDVSYVKLKASLINPKLTEKTNYGGLCYGPCKTRRILG